MNNQHKQLKVDYYIKTFPLYKSSKIEEEQFEFIDQFFNEYEVIQFDSYCVHCNNDSVFKKVLTESFRENSPHFKKLSSDYIKLLGEYLHLEFKCQRDANHIYSFSYRLKDLTITKIGQYPSIADLEIHKISKYRKILSNDYRDFSKALGLYSHDIGAGSFVYLRRIFENLIQETKDYVANSDKTWDEPKYKQSRMDEKIHILKDYLPDFLVQERSLYGILSKGIHELTEDECLELFPQVQLAIELILDEKLAEQEKQSKITTAKQLLSATATRLKN